MKKIVLLFTAILAFSAQAQQTINFKIAYKPNTTYKQTTTQSQTMKVSYDGSEPMEQESKFNTTSTFKTGKLSGGTMPVTMTLTADKDSDAAATLPQGATIYGVVKQDGNLEFDSIVAPGVPAETKNVMMTTMKAMASQFIMPSRTVKVGESFTTETPMELPMGPVIMKMNTKTTYKLVRVEGKKAYFDQDINIDISTNIQGQDTKGSGTGTGTLVYDMENNFFSQQTTNATSAMDMEIQGMKISNSSTQNSVINVEIIPNK